MPTATRTPTRTPTPTFTPISITRTPRITPLPTPCCFYAPSGAPAAPEMNTPASPPPGQVYRLYYYAGSQRVAMRVQSDDGSNDLYYLLTDHLGSTSIVADAGGNMVAELRYSPWGTVRYQTGALPTDYTYTGQRSMTDAFGLMYYNARWYDPALGRFAQADTLIPGAGKPLAWDRYAYTINNPLRYSDPSGHWYYDPGCDCMVDDGIGEFEHKENLTFQRNFNPIDLSNIDAYAKFEPEKVNQRALKEQDLATTFSTIGAGAEIGGCIAFNLDGCAIGNQFHTLVTNPIETIFSTLSLFDTIYFDRITGATRRENSTIVIGEATATSLTTAMAGNISPVGVIDSLIDEYASSFAHGDSNGVYTAIEKFTGISVKGTIISLGPFSIQFGDR